MVMVEKNNLFALWFQVFLWGRLVIMDMSPIAASAEESVCILWCWAQQSACITTVFVLIETFLDPFLWHQSYLMDASDHSAFFWQALLIIQNFLFHYWHDLWHDFFFYSWSASKEIFFFLAMSCSFSIRFERTDLCTFIELPSRDIIVGNC